MRFLFCLLLLSLPLAAEERGILGVGWSASGKYLITTGDNRRIRVHDGATGKLRKAATVPGEMTTTVSFSPDSSHEEPNTVHFLSVSGDYAITGGTDHAVHWWSLPDLKIVAQSSTTYGNRGLSLTAGGRVAGCTSTSTRYLDGDMELLEWNGKEVKKESFRQLPPPDSSESFGVPRFSPDGHWSIAFASTGPRLWSLSAKAADPVELKGNAVLAMGNQHFFVQQPDGVSMHDYDHPDQEIRRYACPGVVAAAVSEDETRLLLSGGSDFYLWKADNTSQPQKWTCPHDDLTASPDLHRIAIRVKKRLEVWDVDARKQLYKLSLSGRLP